MRFVYSQSNKVNVYYRLIPNNLHRLRPVLPWRPITVSQKTDVTRGYLGHLAEQLLQPHPQGLLLVQNDESEKPLAEAAEILQELWSISSSDS